MAETLVVETTNGSLLGQARDAHVAYLGIPYAKPPVGRLRFRPPEAPESWRGVRSAAAYGSSALQGQAFVPGVIPDGPQSEDCLYLNVFTPSPARGRQRPVLVWIHGGAFTIGSASQPLYDGGRLAEAGDVVVVTLNYRVGALGFLSLAGRGDGGANRGLLDQLAALAWVQANIAAFGGDPQNVTLFGESAGGTSVCSWLASPRAEGLFARAIAQSPFATLELATEEQAESTTRAFLDALGLSWERLEELERVPAEALLRAQAKLEQDRECWPHFYPVFDRALWPEQPVRWLASGQGARVPLLIGFNRDEWNLFELVNVADWSKPLDDAAAARRLARKLPAGAAGRAAELLEVYRASRAALGLPHDNRALLRAIQGDLRFGMPTLRFAELYAARDVPTFVYRFTYASPALRGALGACHALDLPFVFGNLNAPDQERFAGTGPAVVQLSERMQRAWLVFAERGDPNHAGLPAWPSYDARRPTLIFDSECALVDAPFEAERAAWDGVF